MPLSGLLAGWAEVRPEQDIAVSGLASDSREIRPGEVFLACAGLSRHGLDFAAQAVQAGAAAILWEPDAGMEPGAELRRRVPCIAVPALAGRAGPIADRFFHHPSRGMEVTGITGTNGKTTVSRFIAHALERAGQACGVIGTLGHGRYPALEVDAADKTHRHTTPDAVRLQAWLAQMRDQGLRHVAMEVSSHALDQGRVNGVAFDVAVWTNLSRDHLDYHGDMAHYAEAKQRLFAWPGLRDAVINADDAAGRELLARYPRAVRYGLGAGVSGAGRYVKGENPVFHDHGLRLDVVSHDGRSRLEAPVLGEFNASNLLAALAALQAMGMPLQEAVEHLATVSAAPGRMECLGGGDALPLVVIDYAHTPDALEQVLRALRRHARGRLWCVFGCGGERDRGKRAQMGRVAETGADGIVITDDNPRREDPARIVAEIQAGMQQPGAAGVEHDRATAIARAIGLARPGDVVLVAGKGHEDYQLIGDERRDFSDRAVAVACLARPGREAQ